MMREIERCEMSSPEPQQPALAVEPTIELEEPTLYHVILLNDDYTPMDFVVDILVSLFQKSHHQAFQIMMEVHRQERGIAGTYSREVAVEKMNQVILSAKANDFPLDCIIEAT